MSDIELDLDTDSDEETVEKANDQNQPKSKKDPLPDGYMTPTQLANELEMRPQQVYGYIKNGKEFPFENHTDGRFIVPVGSGDVETDARAWILDRREKTAARKAAKAAEEAAAAEAGDED